MRSRGTTARNILTGAALVAAGAATPAAAQLVLSEVIVDLTPDKPPREDIEAWNSGKERIYVVAEPSEIRNAGSLGERRVEVADPTQGGLLVTPQRMILEPGERRLIRVAALMARPEQDRIYRVTIKPVVGEASASATAIKILVGYDALVIVRPATPSISVSGTRHARILDLHNSGNSSVELFGGRQCDAQQQHCAVLAATRLYAGATWSQTLPGDGPVTYRLKLASREVEQKF